MTCILKFTCCIRGQLSGKNMRGSLGTFGSSKIPVTRTNCSSQGISGMSSGPRSGRKCARFLIRHGAIGAERFDEMESERAVIRQSCFCCDEDRATSPDDRRRRQRHNNVTDHNRNDYKTTTTKNKNSSSHENDSSCSSTSSKNRIYYRDQVDDNSPTHAESSHRSRRYANGCLSDNSSSSDNTGCESGLLLCLVLSTAGVAPFLGTARTPPAPGTKEREAR